jgi:CheY-like chemotaxis protein
MLVGVSADPQPAVVSLHIVLAEDNPDLAALNERVLEAAGHNVHVAPDGEAALAAVRNDEPDLVLLDFEMPGGDGLTVVEQLRAEPTTANQAVVMMSNGGLSASQELRMRRLGVSDFLAKYRFTPSVLTDWIRRWTIGKVRNFPSRGKRP